MKRAALFAVFALGFCLIVSPVYAAPQAEVLGVTQPTFSLTDNIRSFFGDPNVAYILLTLAVLGLLVEIITPGTFLPGIIGIFAAALAFYALGLLSVNPLGLMLIIVALPLFVLGAYRAAVFIPATLSAVATLAIGSLYLFHPGLNIHPVLIAIVVIVVSVSFILVSNRVVKAQRMRIATGSEGLIRHTATVRTPLEPSGTVMVEGEIWQAELDRGRAQTDEEVVITAVNGLRLTVTKTKGD